MLNVKCDFDGHGYINGTCEQFFMIMLIVSFDSWISQFLSGVAQD